MRKRIMDAWRVLKGTHGVHPKGASWFYANTYANIYATGTNGGSYVTPPTQGGVYR